jgi:hypothetical protein
MQVGSRHITKALTPLTYYSAFVLRPIPLFIGCKKVLELVNIETPCGGESVGVLV